MKSEKKKEVVAAEKKIQEKNNNIGSKIAFVSLASVACIVMLSRGCQKNINKYLNLLKDFLESKMENSLVTNSNKKTKFYEYAVRKTNSFIKKSDSINNITSLKDILFMKLMYKTKPTEKLHAAISDYFEKISMNTVLKSYKKTEKCFERMNKKFDELDEYILKNSADEEVEIGGEKIAKRKLVAKAREYRDYANIIVGAFINPKTIKMRHEYMNKVTSSLYSSFWDVSFKDFWTKNNKFKRKEMWQTFIAAEQIKGDKTDLAEKADFTRNAISYTRADQTSLIYKNIKKLDGIIPLHDEAGMKIIDKLLWFTKNPEIYQNNEKFFLEELKKLNEHKIPAASDSNVAETLNKCKQNCIESIYSQLKESSPGAIQDMLSIYYKIAPFELSNSGASLSVKKAVESFDKSSNLEVVEFFDKIRDLRLGSAPTDILTILLSFVMLSFGFGYAKDNDERTSIILKSGIPIAGGIATALFSAAKLVSGGKSLVLGFLSGIILNQLGVIADNVRKQYQNKTVQ